MTNGDEENFFADLEQYRDYLKMLADMQLNPRLRVKEGDSDIVQQTMLDAHRDFPDFQGKTEVELRAWLAGQLQKLPSTLDEIRTLWPDYCGEAKKCCESICVRSYNDVRLRK